MSRSKLRSAIPWLVARYILRLAAMVVLCRKIAEDRRFHLLILGIIVFNAVLMGLETSGSLMSKYGPLFSALNAAIQVVFVIEIAVRLLAYWPRIPLFFRDGWNVFDFTIITLSLLPVAGPFATVSRLARLLRVTRIVSVSTELRLIIGTMVRSIPSMGHVTLLLGTLVYVYAILGFHLFRSHDPERWSSLKTALLTVFQMLTLDDWVAMQRAVLPAVPWAWVYFTSFVVIGVFIVINLFIAVVLNNLETVKEEQQHAAAAGDDLLMQIDALRSELAKLDLALRRERRVGRDGARAAEATSLSTDG